MASGDSGTASDGSNIIFTVDSIIGGAIGSLAGPEVSGSGAELDENIGRAIAGKAK